MIPGENHQITPLDQLFQHLLLRFRPDNPNAPADTFIFGFITPDSGALSVMVNRDNPKVIEGIQNAQYLIYAPYTLLETLFDPQNQNRAALVEQLQMRPDYPFNNYLFSIFLNTFDLTIPDLDYVAKRFDGPFPFPPRYPAAENSFRLRQYQPDQLPLYQPESLPELIAADHPVWVAMYNKAWQLAFKNLRQPEPTSGFIANFIDPAFNANTFMWDSCFMMLFGRYARQLFNFMGTLDNFYAKQHDDGFICREINSYSGTDLFQSLDPRSTGPNILAWVEWLDYQHSQDKERLTTIFPVLIAYHRWWQDWRTHPNGSYWTSGWGSGMDNQTRVPHSEYHHRSYAWVDANMQQALNCQILLDIAAEIGREEFNTELRAEYDHLKTFINTRLWDEATGFYYDAAPDGTLSLTKSIGAYWGLLSDVVPVERASRLIEHLADPKSFNRPHRIPSQASDASVYNPYGGYWLGGVWSPTNYMVLQGLTRHGYHDLAYEIAHNHVEHVARVYAETGTLWENYAPEYSQPGKPAGKDFVGWTGISAINIPVEYLIGVRPADDTKSLKWDIRLTERHGVLHYPLGASNQIDLIYEPGLHHEERPVIKVITRQPFNLEVIHGTDRQHFTLEAGEHRLQL